MAIWLEFRDAFESLIHKNSNLSEIQKFFYLNTTLTGNYKVAWEWLHIRFENEKLNVQRLLGGLIKILQSLKNYNQPTAGTFLIYIISSKFTRSMKRDWESFKPTRVSHDSRAPKFS